MRKLFFILLTCLLMNFNNYAQGVYISSGTNLYIEAGATVSLDSLVLKPSSNFNLIGLRREYRNSTVVHALSRPYIKRVNHLSATTPAYSGAISVYYRDAELNGIAESALTLNMHDGSSWNVYTSGVTRNSTANYVSTTGLSSVPLNELTLASNTISTLSMNKAEVTEEGEGRIAVYPNPVEDRTTVYIRALKAGKGTLQLYDANGALLKTIQTVLAKGNNEVQLSMQGYAKASYTLTVDWNKQNKVITVIKE